MAYEVEVKEIEAQPVVVARAETTPNRIGATFAELAGEVAGSLGRRSIPTSGPPFGRYFDYSRDHVDMAVGFPVTGPVEDDGRVVASELPSGRVAVVTHVGPYTQLGGAYRAIEAYVSEHGHESAGPPWEVYLVGPQLGGDSATWRTEIVQPVR